MGTKVRTVEQRIAALATHAWGTVATRELLSAGVSARQIRRRLEKGLLIPVFRGVYRVGHVAPCYEATYMAAVKACGEGAVLMGRAAAYHQGILRCSEVPPPEVLSPREHDIEGVTTVRSRRIHPLDRAVHRGIPVTPVPRTLVDLAAVLDEAELARAFHEAHVRYRITPLQVQAVLDRRGRVSGSRKLTRVTTGEAPALLSELERGFFEALDGAGLRRPDANVRVGSKYVDCRWEDPPLTVELDSYRFHNTRHAWEQDHRRRREARARGDEFRRYTWSDVFDDRPAMLAELRDLLG
ncbi:MAG TPA: type IV toxin-antitoxin system AbiEi family antitoxin domain-containing protein [Thermoleophilaceae bacterium]|nr:type IV toxin-antitoxin system AbiEi family antitoxin domain-containing protein [Thermoleophilaceae bacterium]